MRLNRAHVKFFVRDAGSALYSNATIATCSPLLDWPHHVPTYAHSSLSAIPLNMVPCSRGPAKHAGTTRCPADQNTFWVDNGDTVVKRPSLAEVLGV
jgi:hypothetical protein